MDIFVSKQNRRVSVEDVRNTIEKPNYTSIVAVDDDKIVGVVGLAETQFFTGNTGVLDELAVNPEYRRKGIASQLVKKLVEIAKEKRLSYVKLDTTAENDTANMLYEKVGFERKEDTTYKLYLFHLYE